MTALLLTMALIAQAGAISGVVRTEQEKPLRGVRVFALSVAEEAPNKVSLAFMGATEADPSGRFRLSGLPPGRYVVGAGLLSDPTYYPGTTALAEAQRISITNAAVEGVDFALADWSICLLQAVRPAPSGQVTPVLLNRTPGRVISAPATAAAGAVVRVTRSADGNMRTATVGPDGAFTLDLPPGQYDISMLLGPVGFSVGSVRSGDKDLTRMRFLVGPCAGSGTTNVPIEIMLQPDEPRFSIGGRITEADGKGMSSVLVEVDGAFGTVDRSFLKNGAFEFSGLAAGAYMIRVLAEDREVFSQRVEVTNKDVTLELTSHSGSVKAKNSAP